MTNGFIKSSALLLAFIVIGAYAAPIAESDVRKAAEAFVANDAIGSSVLSGRSIAGVNKRGGLWIVALAPDGHVVFSGSDLVDPIVGFSKNDFVEPEPESPAFSVLEGADASVAAAEAQGSGTRHARWTRLLGGGAAKSGLLKADNPSSGAVVVEPFLAEHYNQWQPYNDYAPVYNSSTNVTAYRGRCPCGCVATAAAQIFHRFKWPARIDNTISYNHVFKDDGGHENSFPIRFDGREPMCWSAMSNEYAYSYSKGYKTYYDLRGGVAEAVRYPIARLILWCDVMAHMYFNSEGSSANYGTIASNVSDWYTTGRWVEVGANADYSQVVSDLQAGVPLQVGLNGHEVVAHGWAQDGTSKYIYLNYGWGGGSDGYYNMDNSTIDLPIQEIFVGHYPRAKPQIDPLPAVSGSDLTLSWSFPDFYTNSLSGFTVSLKKSATETSAFAEDFSDANGVVSGDEGIFVVGAHSKGYDGNLLYCISAYSDGQYAIVNSAYYTFPTVYTLTSASVLTLRFRSCYALSNDFEIQARFNGGGWTTIMSPFLAEDGDSGWGTERLYLGDHGGETVQLRFYKAYTSGSCYTEQDCIFVDDLVLTDVLAQGAEVTRDVAASARSCAFTGLDAGSTCTFAVTPVVYGALAQGESSEPMTTSIAGERLTPVPGEQTYSTATLSFSASDTSGVWSYSCGQSGSLVNDTTVRGPFSCSISAALPGELTSTSKFVFSWKTSNSYGKDTLKVVFTDSSGTQTTLWSKSVTKNTAKQSVTNSLSSLAGKTGRMVLSCSHSGSAYTGSSYGCFFYAPKVTNVLSPSVPDVAWDTQTLTALGMPEILSVSAVTEGFYGECGTNASVFTVTCSSTVDSLEARPSHLSLVRDEDVTVTKTGSGTFNVSITPSGINESNFRSRMILTLVGADSNGTQCYKDLSLRFSQVEPMPTEVHVSATTSSGDEFSVEIPYAWIETNGLVPAGSDAAAHEAAVSADADADSDGLPNWAEYVCGTSPTDPTEKLVAFITMVDGEPVVTYSPGDSQIAAGFKAVIKGTTDLAAALSTWEVVTETRTSTCRFFRVEIVPED